MTRQNAARALLVREYFRRRHVTDDHRLVHLRTIRSAIPYNHPTVR